MQKSITRRAAAKAVALGTAAAFVAPAALADGNPDAEIIDLEQEMLYLRDVVLPPLEKAAGEAEEAVMRAAPYQKEPYYTLADLDAQEADMLDALRNNKGKLADKLRSLFEDEYPGADYEAGVKAMYARDREAAEKYAAYLKAHERAEAETGYHAKSEAAIAVYDRANELHAKIMSLTPHTIAGLAVQLRSIAKASYYDMEVSKEQRTAVAEAATKIANRRA